MSPARESQHFLQIHIDVARNATDDFNPFHDPVRWSNIRNNPFDGPIALGFQLEGLIADRLEQFRAANGELELIQRERLHYSNFEFRFVGAVRPGQLLTLTIKPSRFRPGVEAVLSNRVSLYADGKLVLTGYKRESRTPCCEQGQEIRLPDDLQQLPDRMFVENEELFLKRKFINTDGAKNFLCACLVEQWKYIDELAEKVRIPEMFPCSLISCSLLERAWAQGHDFERQPLVYQSHALSIDRRVLDDVRSNNVLHLLNRPLCVDGPSSSYQVYGVVGANALLFTGKIDLLALGE
ncbi:MAG: hypothetical protein Hals2KO_08880 [Halioglobus sp.]